MTSARITHATTRADAQIGTAAPVVGLLFCLLFSTAAFGATQTWSIAVFDALAVLVAALTVWGAASGSFPLRFPLLAAPLLGLLVLALIQSIAWRDGSGRILSLSVDVDRTRSAASVIAALGILFLCAFNAINSGTWFRRATKALAVFTICLSLFGLIQDLTWNGHFYWIGPAPESLFGPWIKPFGPFANRNHFAGQLEMLALIPLALATSGTVRSVDRQFFALAAGLGAVGVVGSLSRGGIISFVVGIAFVVGFMIRVNQVDRRRRMSNGRSTIRRPCQPVFAVLKFVAAAAVVITITIVWVGTKPIAGRLDETLAQISSRDPKIGLSGRPAIWSNSAQIFLDHPIAGVGIGAFAKAYPNSEDEKVEIRQAHNDYLQILTDAGVIGGIIAVAFIAILTMAIVKGIGSTDPFRASLAVGCGGGILAMLVHSFFDFNLQIPSNALLFLILCAIVFRLGLERSAVAPVVAETR